jgi:hypothetical protein
MIPSLVHILLFVVLLAFPCLVWYIIRDV